MNFLEAKAIADRKNSTRLGSHTDIYWHGWLPDSGYTPDEDCVVLSYYTRPLIRWFESGLVWIDNGGYFTKTTAQRLRKFLPKDLKLVCTREFWFIDSPKSSHIFRREMCVYENGGAWEETDMTGRLDGRQILQEVQRFVHKHIALMFRGEVDLGEGCGFCRGLIEGRIQQTDHILDHVTTDNFDPAMLDAAVIHCAGVHRKHEYEPTIGRYEAALAGRLLLKSNHCLWRPVRTRKALVERTERLMTREDGPDMTGINPRKFRRALQIALEEFLLFHLGFEWAHF